MNRDKQIDELIKYTVKEEGLEIPQPGFSDKVMKKILESEQTTVFRPIIPPYVFIMIFAVILILIILVFKGGYSEYNTIPFLNRIFRDIPNFHFNLNIPSSISTIIMIGVVMMMLQAILIGKIYRKMRS